MKKQTLQKWINQQRKSTNQEKQEALRTARQDALSQCEAWIYELTWATMRTPVMKRWEALWQEGQALLQKGAQRSEEENARLAVVRASYAIYVRFLHKITPTARQAEIEQSIRQHERAQRQESSPPSHQPPSQKTRKEEPRIC